MFREFPIIIEGSEVIIVGDKRKPVTTDAEVKLKYIKHPATVVFDTVNCDLPEHTHKQIVKIASNKILQALNVGVE